MSFRLARDLSPDSGVYLIRASNEWTFARFVSLAGVWIYNFILRELTCGGQRIRGRGGQLRSSFALPVISPYSEVKWTHDDLYQKHQESEIKKWIILRSS